MRKLIIAAVLLFTASGPAYAESVNVSIAAWSILHRSPVRTITRSSFIDRVCYDGRNAYMLIELNGTWYHYCEIDGIPFRAC